MFSNYKEELEVQFCVCQQKKILSKNLKDDYQNDQVQKKRKRRNYQIHCCIVKPILIHCCNVKTIE
jgi:hypothetical protein